MSTTATPADLASAVHEALRHWAAGPADGSPLAHLTLVQRAAIGGNLCRATNQVIAAALDSLAADHPNDAALLRTRFLDHTPAAAAAKTRHVAEVTLYKMQRRAIERLTAVLFDQEQQANAARQAALDSRLPPATYDRLFGVEAHLDALRTLLLAPEGPRLIAIEGLGGIGKTALAHQLMSVLAHVGHPFVDFGWVSAQQQFLHAAEGIRQAEGPALTAQALIEALVTQLMAGAAGVAPVSPSRAMNALAARLRAAPHLVVVDNLETMTDVESLLPTLDRLAGPSKFMLTARETFHAQAGVHHFTVPELSEVAALTLVRHVARLHGMPHVADASTDNLRPIYATVGGNPLALRLVAGQLHVLPLAQVLENLREARGKQAEELYTFIYWHAWHRLPAPAQEVLTLMPLFAQEGADLAALRRVCDLPEDALVAALAHLVKLSLVNVGGDLHARRYGIHRLTESFLLKEVIKWRGTSEVAA